MGSRDYARIVRRSWILILAVTLAGALAGWVAATTTKPVYSATSVALITSETGASVNELTQGNAFTERRVSTYASLATEPIVTSRVIEELGLDVTPAQLAARIDVSIPLSTTMLEVTVSDSSPAMAASIANAIITNLSVVVSEVESTTGAVAADGTVPTAMTPVKMTQVRFAEAPTTPISPNVLLNLGIGLFAGLALGTLAAILRELIDTRVRSTEDVEAVTDAPIVGAIPQISRGRGEAALIDDGLGTPAAESFRILRTNLQFLDIDGPATFTITSPGPGDGKSTVALNLANSIAANGSRVLLVEADLRRPQIHESLSLEGGAGLTDVLIGRALFAEVVQTWGSPNLHVLASGRIPPNPSELLGSRHMRDLMAHLQDIYDVVLYDTPPLLPVPDAAILSRSVGGVLLVVAVDRTRRDAIRAATASLEKVGARLAGTVANRVTARGATSYLTESYLSFDAGDRDADSAEMDLLEFPDFARLDGDETKPKSGSMPGGVASRSGDETLRNSRARFRESGKNGGAETLP
ncbi:MULTISPECIES: polysaccharide biosynthesis tyrosine autokinase [unclassified Microbacterium]|uniref:polysaccharide biosynthesis tyrosine autokinase n=1 Tax=unclassified Microbacterium TaxID=2609290 RepID=UPI00214B7C4B|nr:MULTISPECIES: polysaccharide biosynthesis tyrosine autokinase [unclassified Microbacterium]MCR2802131.1 polysaccharide biosynthesis tyrosine autokinase [Microbacterium sp. zg.Y818]MCR2825486.1 polysaccharide biosynthesis tyrosine autokinase [Microbacterium sp. zg.Y909]WIM22677.1 polysaccharide biosynthesis tyrosine autokinase [Microbacterium sp. zg-Y818]